ncbi:MAG: hypothetical protein M0Q53_04665 [Prolixibacteraceae bacterium]|jgi:hypothetical protein|nr:hypothetical protein [Prolixibacteraceae bacterium]
MWKSIVFKEWLKIRWFLIAFTLFGIVVNGYLFLKVQHGFTFQGGTSFWYNILFMRYHYFDYFRYFPLLEGLVIALAQYFPETVHKRIKLTFHLPLKENNVLLMMQAFGTSCLLFSYLLLLLVFISLGSLYFPSEMVYDAIVSVIPWFLAGFVAYFFVALIVLEPSWLYRFLYSLIAGFFVNVYLKSSLISAYGPAIPVLSLLTILMSIALLFPAYRFRKGEM